MYTGEPGIEIAWVNCHSLIFGPGGNILLGEAYLFADIVSSFFGENPEWRTRRWIASYSKQL